MINHFRRSLLIGIICHCLANLITVKVYSATNDLNFSQDFTGTGLSALRVFGALLFVLSLFIGSVWVFKRFQNIMIIQGKVRQMHILEVKHLGPKHAIFIVACGKERYLVGTSPQNIAQLAQLPSGETISQETMAPTLSFADTLRNILSRKT